MAKENLEAVSKLFQEYYIIPLMQFKQHLAHRTEAEPQDAQVLTDAGYEWDEANKIYKGDRMAQNIIALPGHVFIWIWGGIGKVLKNPEKLAIWVGGRGDNFLAKLIQASGNKDEPKFTGTGVRPEPPVSAPNQPPMDDTDKLIAQLKRKAKNGTLPADTMIDVGQQAQKDGNEKLLAFLKTMKPVSEATMKRSQFNELVQHIINGILKEAKAVKKSKEEAPVKSEPSEEKALKIAKQLWGDKVKVSHVEKHQGNTFYRFWNTNHRAIVGYIARKSKWKAYNEPDDKWYDIDNFPKTPEPTKTEPEAPAKPEVNIDQTIEDFANNKWKDPQDIGKGSVKWRVRDKRQHSGGSTSYLLTKTKQVNLSRHVANMNGKWFYLDPDSRKWTEFELGQVKEMTGTAAVAGFQSPFAFKKTKGMKEGDAMNENVQLTPIGEDDWSRPMFRDQNGNIYVDINMGKGTPSIHITTDEGEPMYPIKNYTIAQFKPTGGEINEGTAVNEEELDEESSSGAAGAYNIPSAFSKQGGSKKGMDVSQNMGYELTPIGKQTMERPADKLYESSKLKDGDPICQHCNKKLYAVGAISCPHCGKAQHYPEYQRPKTFIPKQKASSEKP